MLKTGDKSNIINILQNMRYDKSAVSFLLENDAVMDIYSCLQVLKNMYLSVR